MGSLSELVAFPLSITPIETSYRVDRFVRQLGSIFQIAEVFSENGLSFLASCQNIVPRLGLFLEKDIILGISPFARELLRCVAQGCGIETNLYAPFKCDSLNLRMVKHPEAPRQALADKVTQSRHFHAGDLSYGK